MLQIDTSYLRTDTPQVGVAPYRQIHLHSTANARSTAASEASYMSRKNLSEGYYTHVVGNGKIYQTAHGGRGAYDVGGDWNYETYAAVELIESHTTYDEFLRDYKLYIELLRQLGTESGIAFTLDTPETEGFKTHNYATATGHGSDHVDPLPYLGKWGISFGQLKNDLLNGFEEIQESRQPGILLGQKRG